MYYRCKKYTLCMTSIYHGDEYAGNLLIAHTSVFYMYYVYLYVLCYAPISVTAIL